MKNLLTVLASTVVLFASVNVNAADVVSTQELKSLEQKITDLIKVHTEKEILSYKDGCKLIKEALIVKLASDEKDVDFYKPSKKTIIDGDCSKHNDRFTKEVRVFPLVNGEKNKVCLKEALVREQSIELTACSGEKILYNDAQKTLSMDSENGIVEFTKASIDKKTLKEDLENIEVVIFKRNEKKENSYIVDTSSIGNAIEILNLSI